MEALFLFLPPIIAGLYIWSVLNISTAIFVAFVVFLMSFFSVMTAFGDDHLFQWLAGLFIIFSVFSIIAGLSIPILGATPENVIHIVGTTGVGGLLIFIFGIIQRSL